jgi:hypothetical protein
MNMAGINITHGVSEYPDFVIDEIVVRCGDDMHGALKPSTPPPARKRPRSAPARDGLQIART